MVWACSLGVLPSIIWLQIDSQKVWYCMNECYWTVPCTGPDTLTCGCHRNGARARAETSRREPGFQHTQTIQQG